MQTVLITRENSEKLTHVSVYLWNNYSEANHFCCFVNNLTLAGEDKLAARIILPNAEHSLEKHQPFNFDDFVKVDDRMIQCLMRELDSQVLVFALKEATKEMKYVFSRNMSKRAWSMLEEDMEYMGPVDETDIENARKLTVNIYKGLPPKENRFDKMWSGYKNHKENNTKDQADSDDRNHIVLVFLGTGITADSISVYLFDKYNDADNFCDYLNNLKPEKESFFYARHADQMVEYEITKPLLVSFDQIFELCRLRDEWSGTRIIGEALKKIDPDIILGALKGMDKRSRTLIMQSLPVKTTDKINEKIEQSDNYSIPLSASRRAQQKIIDAVNKTAKKFKQENFIGISVCKV
jgi:hypothetical protein